MKSRWNYFAHVLVLAGLLTFTGCGGTGTDNTGAGSGGKPAAAERKLLTVAGASEPQTVLPALARGPAETLFTRQLFISLTEVDHNLNIIPGAARAWEWDEETLTYTFHLRDDIHFHDGTPLTADDVLWTLKYAMHPDYEGPLYPFLRQIVGAAGYRAGAAADVSGLGAPDRWTVTLQLSERDAAALLYIGSGVGIMPKHYYEPYVAEHGVKAVQGSEAALPPLGAGPFQWQEWQPGEQIILTKYDGFFRKEPEVEGQVAKARVDEVRVRFMADDDTLFRALQAGRIDLMDNLTAAQFHAVIDNPALQAIQYPYLFYYQLMFNFQDPKFQDLRVRQAIAHGINRNRLVAQVLDGFGTAAAGGHTHPLRWDYSDEFAALHPKYDPDRTIALMVAAGWTIAKDEAGKPIPGAVWTKDGQEFQFEIATGGPDPVRAGFQRLIQQDLAALGFRVSGVSMANDVFYDDYLVRQPWTTAIAAWRLGADPSGSLELIFGCRRTPAQNGYNWPHFCSEGGTAGEQPGRLTELDLAGRRALDRDERLAIYREANRLLIHDLPYVWLAYPDGLLAAAAALQGIEPVHPSGWYMDLWRIDW